MAFGNVGASGTGVSSTSTSSWTLTTSGNSFNASSFRFGVLRVCVDNLSTSDGATNDVTSVTGGNGTWTKLGEYTNGEGSAAAGVTVALFLFMPSGNNAVGTVFTINLSGNAVDKTAQFFIHTHASGQSVQKAGSEVGGATDASNNFASVAISGLSSKEYLFVAVHGKEANTTTSITVSSSFTTSGGTLRSRNNADAVALCGEYRINTSTGETSNPTLAVSGDAASLIVALEEYTPGSGAISGSSTVTFTGAGALTGSGALAGSSAVAFAPTASLQGAGALSGVCGVSFAPAAIISATGALAGTISAAFTLAGDLTGSASGAMTGSAQITTTVSGTIAATGLLGGASVIQFSVSGSLTQPITTITIVSGNWTETRTATSGARGQGISIASGDWDEMVVT